MTKIERQNDNLAQVKSQMMALYRAGKSHKSQLLHPKYADRYA